MSFYQPSPFRPRTVSVTPFNVKRKQVNPDVLVPNSSLGSSSSKEAVPDPSLLQAKIDELETQLKKVTQDQQSWRHKCLLLTNEREAFELACREKAAREKDLVLLEVKLLKEVHLEKIQSLSSAMAQWQSRVASLRAQLKQHSIEEETIDNDSSWLLTASLKEDAEFIKDAHRKAMQPENNKTTNQLWNSIDTSTIALRQDIDSFQLWRSLAAVPIADLTKEESDRIGHAGVSSSLRKAFFGRSRSSKRTK